MAEKKTHQIAVHLSDSARIRIARFAEREGLTASEYVHRLIERDIQSKVDELRMLQTMLEVDGSLSFPGTE